MNDSDNNRLYRFPELYDSLYRDFTDDIDWVARRIARLSPRHRNILEYGCGSGRIIGSLAARLGNSWKYIGIDLAPEMISRARQMHPDCSFETGDMTHFRSREPAGWQLLLANTLGHIHSPEDRHAAYETMKTNGPGGYGVVAVMTLETFDDSMSGLVPVGDCFDGDSWYDVYESSRNTGEGIQEVTWFFQNRGDGEDLVNRFHLSRFESGQLERELTDSGLNVIDRLAGFGGGDNNWDICIYRV